MQSPQIINLETAIDHIKQACDECESVRSPFFFMVGAGLSYPSIPLAPEITRHCKETALKYKRTDEPSGTLPILPIDEYEHWLNKAYPHARPRQRYLRDLIENKPISPANFRLAHLLLDKKITNLVVTPNFDDFLSRALTLFGKPHIVCDHPQTVDRIDPEQADLQIIHIHGTYWFYDCCNLRGEIEKRAKPSPHTTQTMASLLDRILSNHAPLVIGYSGWEDDVFMTALKRRLQSPLPYNLYWFCYSQSEIGELPDELKSSHQVYFVVLPAPQPDPDASVTASYGAEKQKTESAPFKAKLSSDKEKEPSTLPAKDVLDRLIQIFKLDAPELTKDPLGFFAKHLRCSLIHDKMEDDKPDIYRIGSVIDKIKRAKALEEEAAPTIEIELEKIRDAARRLEYGTVINLASQIDWGKLSDKQIRELMDITYEAAFGLSDNSNEELNGYDLAIQIGDKLTEKNISDSALQKQVAKALVNKGFRLGSLNQRYEAIAVYDEVVKRFGNSKEHAMLEPVAKALYNKGITLGSLNQSDEAIAVYDEVVKRFGNAKEPALLESVAKALVNKGFTLRSLNRSDEAIAVYDEVVKRFGNAKEPALLEQVAKALVNKGVRQVLLEKKEDSQKTFSRVIESFGANQEVNIQSCVVPALAGLERFNEANSLLQHLAQKDKQKAKECIPDLELLSSAPQASDEMKRFFEEAKKMLGKTQRKGVGVKGQGS